MNYLGLGIFFYMLNSNHNTLYNNLNNHKLGNFSFLFPSDWENLAIEGRYLNNEVTIEANSDEAIQVTFKNQYQYLPLVIPVVCTTSGIWGYLTSTVANLKTTGCTIYIHNLEKKARTVMVGYSAFR